MPFAAIYVPDFPVEAMVRAEPELRERAVAVVEGTPPLVHVIAVNERAAQAGVEPGMTRLQAEERLVDGPLGCARGRLWSMAGSELRVASCETRQSEIEGKIPTLSRPKEGRDKGGATARKSGFTGEGARATKCAGTLRERSAEREAAAHAALLDCACGVSPRVEDTAADTVVLDLAGLERIFGAPAKMARDVARRCSEMGLETNVAVASNADTAVLAARGLAGVTVIPEGAEAQRVGELSVEVLVDSKWSVASGQWPAKPAALDHPSRPTAGLPGTPGGGERAPAGLEILETLERWGVRNLRALAALPEVALAERLGQEGLRLQKLARGETRRPLVVAEPPLVFEEAADLEYPVDLLEPLAFLLNRMLEQLCARLAARALATNELKLRFELDVAADIEQFFTRTLRLPVPMLDAKVFLKLLQLDLQAHPPQAPVTKVWLRAEPAEPRRVQNGLFVPEAPEAERLSVTLARIARVVGGNCELRVPSCEQVQQAGSGTQETTAARVGSPEILDTHRAEGFRMKPFAASGQWPAASGQENRQSTISNRKWANGQQDAFGECGPTSPQDSTREGALRQAQGRLCATPASPLTALRVFRPALAAVVALREGKPAHVASPERPTMRGEVVWCAGPWRASGEWWTEQAWSRQEWDVAVRHEEGVALYRIYRDEVRGKWFVEGSYD